MSKNVNHVNICVNGTAYCERVRKVVFYDDIFLNNECHKCSFFNGSAQGDGVECLYLDPRIEGGFIRADSPVEEYTRRSKLPPAEQEWNEETEKSLAHVVTLK